MTTSLKIAEVFEKQHNHVLRDIRKLEKHKDVGPSNFGLAEYVDAQGKGRSYYSISRKGFMLLAMGFTGNKAIHWKVKFTDAFEAMEERLSSQVPSVTDMSRMDIIQIAMDAEKERLLLENQNKQLEHQVKDAQPTIAAMDRLEAAKGSVSITRAAKTVKMSPLKLFKYLNEKRWIYRHPECLTWIGRQDKINTGYLSETTTVIKGKYGNERIQPGVHVTGKGLAEIAKMLEKDKDKFEPKLL